MPHHQPVVVGVVLLLQMIADLRRNSAEEHTKAIVTEIRLKKYIEQHSKYQLKATKGSDRNHEKQCDAQQALPKRNRRQFVQSRKGIDILNQMGELDRIASELRVKQQRNRSERVLRAAKNIRKQFDTVAEKERRLTDGLFRTDAGQLGTFVTGGYLNEDDERNGSWPSMQRIHRKFHSMEKMCDLVKQSERFKMELHAEKSGFAYGSFASYVLHRQQNNLGKVGKKEHPKNDSNMLAATTAKTFATDEPALRRRRKKKRKFLSEISPHQTLLASLQLMKLNFRTRTMGFED